MPFKPRKYPHSIPPQKMTHKAQYGLWQSQISMRILRPMTSYVKHWQEMHPLRRFVNRELHYFLCKLAFNKLG